MTKSRAIMITVFATVLALVLRLHHLDWALPHAYEEATPLRIAFKMWGWDRGIDVNLNPGFFNYPSFILYLHFAAQGLLYSLLRLTGGIDSLTDWQVMYLVDPSVIYIAARLVTVSFAVGTVLITVLLGRLIAGWLAGVLAVFLLATNAFHIAKSQMIEVDVPLAFFVTAALYVMGRMALSPTRRDQLLAGAAIGLAASSKYTGFLLVVPLLAAHWFGRRSLRPQRPLWTTIGVACLVFVATSPFIVLDYRQFLSDFLYERAHMAEGHFGQSRATSLAVYGRALTGGVISLPMAILAFAGVALVAIRRRGRAAAVLVTFLIAYLAAVSSWQMRADRYLLPLLPALHVFAAAALAALLTPQQRASGARLRYGLGRAVAIGLVLEILAIEYNHRDKVIDSLQYDARTETAAWLEANVPAGAFIVTEHQGPDLLSPSLLLQLEPPLRARVLSEASRPVYATQRLPMSQTSPEQAAPFYAPSLYPCADYVITSSAVRGRYERESSRFPAQLAFYAWLDSNARTVRIFKSPNGAGPHLTIYRLPTAETPFGDRRSVPLPPELPTEAHMLTWYASFFHQLGANYEFFGHNHEAYVCYVRALEGPSIDPGLFMHCVLGVVRTLLSNRQLPTAVQVLDRLAESAPDRDSRLKVLEIRAQLLSPLDHADPENH